MYKKMMKPKIEGRKNESEMSKESIRPLKNTKIGVFVLSLKILIYSKCYKSSCKY